MRDGRTSRARWLAGLLAFTAISLLATWMALRAPTAARDPSRHTPHAPAPTESARMVGGKVCAGCHAAEYAAWSKSHHAQSMQPASADSVLGDFNGATFRKRDQVSTFFRRDGRYFVRTDGPDGKAADFEIRWTFGFDPLQQYLVEFPDGRKQVLGIAWDSRPRTAGGQHWFDLYPEERLVAGDRLHWTGLDQNWNHQCADCHSTGLRKNFDPQTGAFHTTWDEMNVSCESCHGPGSAHVAWARERDPGKEPITTSKGPATNEGLAVGLDERRGVSWQSDPGRIAASRSRPRTSAREIDACAHCHSRRGQFRQAMPGSPFTDSYRPALLTDPIYFADGQIRGEAYEYGSFLQSRMNARGVTCSDCHEPHSQQLRASGNALCAQCHAPQVFDTPRHHHHPVASAGAQCVSCHMPTRTYMRVDVRHDHSLRIPRPDLSKALGTPDPCTSCHQGRLPSWATAQIRTWYPNPRPGFQDFAATFAAADRDDSSAQATLVRIARDPAEPALVRASALRRLARLPDGIDPESLEPNLSDPDPLVRSEAVAGLAGTPPALRTRLLGSRLDDPSRLVRIELARALAGTSADDARLAPLLTEATAELRLNADRPDAQVEAGNLALERRDLTRAEADYRQALRLDPRMSGAAINLANLLRIRGEETLAEQALLEALHLDPDSAPLHHALGLSLVRQRRTGEALAQLERAAQLQPGEPHWAYVLAVGLFETGHRDKARRVLEASLALHPQDRELLQAQALFREAPR